MKLDVIKLDGGKAGDIELNADLFGLEPRADILHRVVRWQRNNAQAGTHKVKTRSETSYSTKKIYRQKGTGGARHGDRNAPIFRKGGIYKGPTPRSHGHDLTKKFRKLGLRHALSAKAKAGELVVRGFELLCDDVPVSIHWGFLYKQRYYAYLCARNMAFDAISPGRLHLGMVLEVCATPQMRAIELLSPDSPYKLSWAPETKAIDDFSLPLSARGDLFEVVWTRGIRPQIKRLFYALPSFVRRHFTGSAGQR